jgi:hypothetical protein
LNEKSLRNEKGSERGRRKKKEERPCRRGERYMDCDITTNWDDAHNPFVFYEILCTAISDWSQGRAMHTAGPKNPMHADHINLAITSVFDMSLSCRCNPKIGGG